MEKKKLIASVALISIIAVGLIVVYVPIPAATTWLDQFNLGAGFADVSGLLSVTDEDGRTLSSTPVRDFYIGADRVAAFHWEIEYQVGATEGATVTNPDVQITITALTEWREGLASGLDPADCVMANVDVETKSSSQMTDSFSGNVVATDLYPPASMEQSTHNIRFKFVVSVSANVDGDQQTLTKQYTANTIVTWKPSTDDDPAGQLTLVVSPYLEEIRINL